MKTPFKMKGMSFGNSPIKNTTPKTPSTKGFNFTGSSKANTPGFNQTKIGKAVRTQNFRDLANKTKTVSSKTNIGSRVVQSVKKGTRNILKGASRLAGGVGLAAMAYDAYKSGQKHSGGKAVKGQKTGVVTPDKSKSIWKK